MTKNPAARRVHRPDTGTDDAFVANVLETSVWARQHAKILVGGLVAVALIAIGAIWITSSRGAAEDRAITEFTPIRALVQAGQSEQAIPQLEAFLGDHGKSKPAREARLLLASQYLASNQAAKAIEAVEPLGTDYENPVAVNAALIRAAAYEAMKEPHRAEELYLALGEAAPFEYQKLDAFDNAARLRMERQDAAGAAELYQRLVDMTPDENQVKQIWQMRLAEAQAAAAARQGS